MHSTRQLYCALPLKYHLTIHAVQLAVNSIDVWVRNRMDFRNRFSCWKACRKRQHSLNCTSKNGNDMDNGKFCRPVNMNGTAYAASILRNIPRWQWTVESDDSIIRTHGVSHQFQFSHKIGIIARHISLTQSNSIQLREICLTKTAMKRYIVVSRAGDASSQEFLTSTSRLDSPGWKEATVHTARQQNTTSDTPVGFVETTEKRITNQLVLCE